MCVCVFVRITRVCVITGKGLIVGTQNVKSAVYMTIAQELDSRHCSIKVKVTECLKIVTIYHNTNCEVI